MTQKENYITSKFKKVIQEYNPNAQLILFGSHARQTANNDSDWDLLVLISEKVDRNIERSYRDLFFDIELEIGEPITVFVHSKSDWHNTHKATPIYQNIEREGILL